MKSIILCIAVLFSLSLLGACAGGPPPKHTDLYYQEGLYRGDRMDVGVYQPFHEWHHGYHDGDRGGHHGHGDHHHDGGHGGHHGGGGHGGSHPR